MKLEFISTSKPPTRHQIHIAEHKLGLRFAFDYFDYLSTYGVGVVSGHELTGITPIQRLNVIEVTEALRLQTPEMPANLYVVQRLVIGGITILQEQNGMVYAMKGPGILKVEASSLKEYLDRGHIYETYFNK